MLTILEMAVRELAGLESLSVPKTFLEKLAEMHAGLKSPEMLAELAQLVGLEESAYRRGHKNNYFADAFGADVLTDTTERSPTYCTPPFRKFDDTTATESWAYLFLPEPDATSAWRSILKRAPRCVAWSEAETGGLVSGDKLERTQEIVRKISAAELMRFRIGLDGVPQRPLGAGDCAVAVLNSMEMESSPEHFQHSQLAAARKAGAQTGLIYFSKSATGQKFAAASPVVFVPVPETGFLLGGVTRVAVKLVMNALSTCTMVRLGRVMGNYMIWVVPSNLKLIDRATRYITKLTDLEYEAANALLFDILEYVEPRMKADQAYPPVVGMAVLRAKRNLTNEQAERQLSDNAAL